MTFVLTNDDGIEAPGLETLYRICSAIGPTVIVAPEEAQSGVGHRVTVRTPLTVNRLSTHCYSVGGTPADCARLALKQIVPQAAWLIAGINPGANLGSDVFNSGTVAAAREAAILGCRAMALSQYIARDETIDWNVTGYHTEPVVTLLLKKGVASGCYWNVNLPHPLTLRSRPAHRFCPLDTNPHRYAFRKEGDAYRYVGVIHDRPRTPGHDVAVCFGGAVSITRLSVADGCKRVAG
jgi:5'-nucleotidase